MTLIEQKTRLRAAAFARRKQAHLAHETGTQYLRDALKPYQGKPLAGYMAMRTEIDPSPVMAQMCATGIVGVPVIIGEGQPLQFRAWTPDTPLEVGAFGAQIPQSGAWVEPEVVLVPLVAYDRRGGRLGYGGGFYDRTLQKLRAKRQVLAIGYAYSAQECEAVPLEPTDQPLDLIVTEKGVITPDL